jgi:ribose transport system substrate-binding protein
MRRKKCVVVILALAMVMMFGVLSGCSAPSSEQSAAPSDPIASESASVTESNDLNDPVNTETAELSDLSQHEVYKNLDDIAFGGVSLPTLQDRSSIKKNLPVEQKENVVVGWASPTQGSSFFVGNRLGAEEKCKEYGYTLKFLDAGNFDSADQSKDIEDLVTQGVDVLVVDPCDTQGNLTDVQRAVEAGIPVVSSGVAFGWEAPVITTVTNNNYESAYATGMYAATLFKENITMCMIPGVMGHPVSDAESNGFLAGWVYQKQKDAGTAKPYREDAMLEAYNYFLEIRNNGSADMSKYGMIVAGTVDGNFMEADGLTAAEDLLTAHPETSLIWAHNDHMGMGAAKVVKERGLQDKVTIVCCSDGDAYGLEAVKNGDIKCTGYNSGLALGKNVIELIHKIFAEGYDANNMPIVTPLPIHVITKDNVDGFIQEGSEYSIDLFIDFKTIDEINAEK